MLHIIKAIKKISIKRKRVHRLTTLQNLAIVMNFLNLNWRCPTPNLLMMS